MNLYSIETGNFKLDGGAMFGVVPKNIWQKSHPADADNLCSLAMRSLLIEDGNKLILIDTGIGTKQSEKFFSYYHLHGDLNLEKSLARLGFSKNDITDVFLTHLHLDHVGGAVERAGEKLKPAFINANYWTNAPHWLWATDPNPREKASFLHENIIPLQNSGQLQFIPEKQNSFMPDFKITYVFGHTESMMLPEIEYRGTTILFVADLVPTATHLPIPYIAGYDVFPLTAMEEKKRILKEACKRQTILFFEHDPSNECCNLIETEKGIRMGDSFKLSDL